MYDIRTKMGREILGDLRSHFADKMFKSVINFNTKIKEASSFGQPINEYDSTSRGQKDFQTLAEEVIGSEVRQQRRQMVNSLADQIETISTSADELLKTAKVPVRTMPSARTEKPRFTQETQVKVSEEIKLADEERHIPEKATETKLSDYYGVNQVKDAIIFVTLYPRADSVQVAGDFNNWQPTQTPMEKVGESGVWQTEIKLPRGKYRYRLVVDGQWQQDPYNELTEMNPFGDFNSILEAK